MTGRGGSISSAGDSGENRPKSVCTFDFGGPKRLQCLRAVGLRPDSDGFRMRPYAPYAVPLKGKGPKRSDSQKRRIKCIRLSACALSLTDRPIPACGQKAHNQCVRLHAKCIRTHKCDGSVRMSSEVKREDILSLSLFRLHPCPSGPLRPEIDCKLFFSLRPSTRPPPA